MRLHCMEKMGVTVGSLSFWDICQIVKFHGARSKYIFGPKKPKLDLRFDSGRGLLKTHSQISAETPENLNIYGRIKTNRMSFTKLQASLDSAKSLIGLRRLAPIQAACQNLGSTFCGRTWHYPETLSFFTHNILHCIKITRKNKNRHVIANVTVNKNGKPVIGTIKNWFCLMIVKVIGTITMKIIETIIFRKILDTIFLQ